jgi:hypothetical protein
MQVLIADVGYTVTTCTEEARTKTLK